MNSTANYKKPELQDGLRLKRLASLVLIQSTPKGRGVFAGDDIPAGAVIDTCPVLVLDPQENVDHIEHTSLYHYTYNWPLVAEDGKVAGQTQAVILGLGSMFNHSRRGQNVGWERDFQNQVVVYRALVNISAGQELCISYGDHLTFVDADGENGSDREIDEDENDVLGKIQLD